MNHRPVALTFCAVLVLASSHVIADDAHLQAAGPIGVGYVGIYYGLVDPGGETWYQGEDFMGGTSTTWQAVVDTGSSACMLGTATQAAYSSFTSIPLQPGVTFTDEGFGGFEDFAVTEPVRLMICGYETAYGDPENHSLYSAYGPIGVAPPSITMSARLGTPTFDVDIIGMSVLQGRVLHVSSKLDRLESVRLLPAMPGSLTDTPPPPPGSPGTLYVPVVLQDFFPTPQPVDVGDHPMLPVSVRKDASDEYATRTALFDSGSPLNFVSASFATDAGIDLIEDVPDFVMPIGGIGGATNDRDGYFVDALALDLGADREGDKLIITNTAVCVIPDDEMPGDLDAILGNNVLSPALDLSFLVYDTPVVDWYVDTRDSENSYLIIVVPEPATLSLLAAGAVLALRRRRRKKQSPLR